MSERDSPPIRSMMICRRHMVLPSVTEGVGSIVEVASRLVVSRSGSLLPSLSPVGLGFFSLLRPTEIRTELRSLRLTVSSHAVLEGLAIGDLMKYCLRDFLTSADERSELRNLLAG